ncbi:site-specific integrase [Vibrio sp. B1Z05]|uniref:site-specific integrase n=1 Tax=Vibrio sp. B1Z05 TaxID=2654980 RepID=UPI00128CDEFC|nr:site-specific integrase [Vibrio sp. B1Z05]MPW37289.1 tyrosine-type recombinase/integrase [Vibrio sp. B1Z05]
MRYLSANANGTWQFRFQIPKASRYLFDGKTELKRSLGKCSSKSAKLQALKLESFVRRVLIKDHTPEKHDDSDLIIKEIEILINSGSLSLSRAVLTLKNHFNHQDLANSRSLTTHSEDQLKSVGNVSPDLVVLNDIYRGDKSPLKRADEWITRFDTQIEASLLVRVVNYYQLMFCAKQALQAQNWPEVELISHKLKTLAQTNELLALVQLSSDSAQAQSNKQQSSNRYSLETVLKSYAKDKRIVKGINTEKKQHTKIESELRREVNRCRLVHKLIGVDDISKITREKVVNAIALISELPIVPVQSKHKALFDKTPVKEWAELGKKLGLRTFSHRTVFSYVSAASALYEWSNRHVDSLIGNPWRGVIKKRKSGQSQLNERNPFSNEHLKLIFSQKHFANGISALPTRKGRKLYYQYWLPVIALYSGMRPNEIAQLHRKDIKCRNGIYYFDINELREDQSLKNSGANRIVPIHSKLIELGFLDFVAQFNNDHHLFPELKYYDRDGYFKNAGEWFRRFIKEILPDSEKLSFYSFRHTFADCFKQHQVNPTIPGTLLGHKTNTITFDVYGGKVELNTLKENIEMVEFEGVLEMVI